MRRTNAPVVTWITIAALLVSMSASLTFSQGATAQSDIKRTGAQSESRDATDNRYPTLSKYATDLTLLAVASRDRSEEHTSELQSHLNLVCRLLLEKKKKRK